MPVRSSLARCWGRSGDWLWLGNTLLGQCGEPTGAGWVQRIPPVKHCSRQDGCAALRQEMAVQAERFELWAAGNQDLRGVASLPAEIEPVIIVNDLLSLAEYLPKPIFPHKSDAVTVARETSAQLLNSRVLC